MTRAAIEELSRCLQSCSYTEITQMKKQFSERQELAAIPRAKDGACDVLVRQCRETITAQVPPIWTRANIIFDDCGRGVPGACGAGGGENVEGFIE